MIAFGGVILRNCSSLAAAAVAAAAGQVTGRRIYRDELLLRPGGTAGSGGGPSTCQGIGS